MKWWNYEMIWNALLFSRHAGFYNLLRSLSERLPCDGDFCTFCPEVICCCTGVTVVFFLNPSQSIEIETCVNRQQTNEARARHASRRFWTYTSRQNFRATHARPVLQHRPLETCAFLMLLWNTSKLLLANTWNSKTGSLACADVAWIWPGTWWAWIARWQLLENYFDVHWLAALLYPEALKENEAWFVSNIS